MATWFKWFFRNARKNVSSSVPIPPSGWSPDPEWLKQADTAIRELGLLLSKNVVFKYG